MLRCSITQGKYITGDEVEGDMFTECDMMRNTTYDWQYVLYYTEYESVIYIVMSREIYPRGG